jgi:hypothetical protein
MPIGGCCPGGYSCTNNGCIPLSGSSYSQTCDSSSYLCPQSLGGGCCHSNYACGNGVCHRTSFSTVNITLTTTSIDADSQTVTITTTIETAYSDPALAQISAAPGYVSVSATTPTPTAAAKVDPTSTPTSGLTQSQLYGVIAAAVILSVIVIIATYLIIRRLNIVATQNKSAAANSGSGSRTRSSSRPHMLRQPPSHITCEFERLSCDPLMETSSNVSTNGGVSRPSAVHNTGTEPVHTPTPPIPAPYGPSQGYFSYQQVPTNEAHYYDNIGHSHQHSADTAGHPLSPPINPTSAIYSEPRSSSSRDQTVRFGSAARPGVAAHGRQRSDTSDSSQQSSNTSIAELDAGLDGERGSSVQKNMLKRMSPNLGRRRRGDGGRGKRSGSGGASGAGSAVGTTAGIGQLEKLPESEADTGQRSAESPSHGVGAQALPKSPTERERERELERREGQKVMGLGDEILSRGGKDKMTRDLKEL